MKRSHRDGRRSYSTPTATVNGMNMWSLISPSILTKDKRINAAFYGVAVSPVDGSIWGTGVGYSLAQSFG